MRTRRRLRLAAVVLLVLVGLVGFGVYRSDTARAEAAGAAAQSQGTADIANLSSDSYQQGLATQLTTARERLRRLDGEVATRVAALEDVEVAGRRFVREMRLIQTLREAARSLSEQPPEPTEDTGSELAKRTTAVLDAYRELSPEFRPPS